MPYRFIEEHCWEAVSVTLSSAPVLQRHVSRFCNETAHKAAAADLFFTANGFEEEIGGGCLLIRNSWGEWARNNELAHHFGASFGYGIVPYRFIEEHCWEAVSVTLSSAPVLQRHVSRFCNETAHKAAAAGSSWWEATRSRVIAQARERLYGLD